MPFLLPRVATKPHQSGDQWCVSDVIDTAEDDAAAKALNPRVEGQVEEALLQLAPARHRLVAIGHERGFRCDTTDHPAVQPLQVSDHASPLPIQASILTPIATSLHCPTTTRLR